MSEQGSTPNQAAWSDVDKVEDTNAFLAYLDTVRSIDAASVYKANTLELMRLQPGQRALDVGCGTGDDARKLLDRVGPGGSVLGIDFSAAMVEESRRRWCAEGLPLEFAVGDVHALALPDASFHAVRADRMFQHLASPEQALAELHRVTRPGGRVVLSDPDWGTYVMDGPRSPAFERYLEFARGQARNPWIGRQFYGLFRAAGLTEIELFAHVIFFLDYGVLEKMGNLDAGFLAAVQAGQMSEDDVAEVKLALRERQASGRFLTTVNVYTAAATRPA